MCDYSLHGVAARPARVGDKLVTTQFWNTTTRGFSAVEEPRVAVCLLPGTEVAFENKVERHLTGFHLLFRRTKPLPHQVARFRQVNMDCTAIRNNRWKSVVNVATLSSSVAASGARCRRTSGPAEIPFPAGGYKGPDIRRRMRSFALGLRRVRNEGQGPPSRGLSCSSIRRVSAFAATGTE